MRLFITFFSALILSSVAYAQMDSSRYFNHHSFSLLNNENIAVPGAKVFLNGSMATYDPNTGKYEIKYQVRDFRTGMDLPFHIRAYHPEYDSLDAMIAYGNAYREFYLFRKGEPYFNNGGNKYGGQKYPGKILAVLNTTRESREKILPEFESLMHALNLSYTAQEKVMHHSLKGLVFILEKKDGMFTDHKDSVCDELNLLRYRKNLFLIVGPAISFGPGEDQLLTVSHMVSINFHGGRKEEGLKFLKAMNMSRVSGSELNYLFELNETYLTEGLNAILEKILSCPAVKSAGYNSLMFTDMLGI